MGAIIPDPEHPESLALNEDGELLGGVFIRSADDDSEPWRHVGWSKGFTLGTTPPAEEADR